MDEKYGSREPKPERKKKSRRISNNQKVSMAKQYEKRLKKEPGISILSYYAKKHGKDVRTIQRYIKRGRELIAYPKPGAKASEISRSGDRNNIDDLKQHLIDIGKAIEKIKYTLIIPHISEMTGDTFVEVEDINSEPLLECLKEHLLSDDFWDKVSEWYRLFEQYRYYCGHLVFDYTEEEKIWQRKISKLKDFMIPIYYRIERSSLGWSTRVLAADHRFVRRAKQLKQQGDHISTSEILVVDDYKVLEADDVTPFISLYKLMSDRFLNGEATRNVIKSHDQLRPVSYGIDKHLGKFLFNRKYLMRSCYVCRELME
jgi:hypothetical protein